jgi:hypothetical protein|tara:strand:- start:91 stop:471 length:381 start_codon:yes stop_codon:yes gene_type:complete
MAHFAKLGIGNIVERVEVVSNDIATTEQAGIDFLNNLHNTRDIWKQTSYNSIGGEHTLGGTAFRKNFAMIGGRYNSTLDGFVPIQPYHSWTLNETTCLWEAPVDKPNDGNDYKWNETTRQWDLRIV